jgi:hypothetical protein
MLKPISEIKANLGLEPNGRVQKFFTATCAKHMDRYVPYDEGMLRNYIIRGSNIIYNQPYAHYMYKGDVMGPNIPIKEGTTIVGWFSPKGRKKHYTGKKIKYNASSGHEYAGPYWDKRMVSAEMQDVVKEVQDYVGR